MSTVHWDKVSQDEKPSIAVVYLTTCKKERLQWLRQSVELLETIPFDWEQKIVSADDFPGYGMEECGTGDWLKARGWDVSIVKERSQVRNLQNVLNKVNSEWILYLEEDVLLEDLPRMSEFITIANQVRNDRYCGMIGMNGGGSQFNANKGAQGDWVDMEKRIILKNNRIMAVERDDRQANSWFISFPAKFIRTSILHEIHDYSKKYLTGVQIEQALTTAYFSTNKHSYFYKATVGKPEMINIALESPLDFDKNALFLRFLDAQTGGGTAGGVNTY